MFERIKGKWNNRHLTIEPEERTQYLPHVNLLIPKLQPSLRRRNRTGLITSRLFQCWKWNPWKRPPDFSRYAAFNFCINWF